MLRIKEICKERGVKMKDLAEAIGTTPSTLSQQMQGSISLTRLTKIAEFLDVPVTDLFETIEVQVKIGKKIINFKRYER